MEFEPNRKEPSDAITAYDVYCPHCGIEQAEAAENFVYNVRSGTEFDCDECEKKFTALKDVVVNYTTIKED